MVLLDKSDVAWRCIHVLNALLRHRFFFNFTDVLKNKMEEITSELKHLIKLQRQRPAFARTISWEFSQSEDGQKKKKSKRKSREAPQVCNYMYQSKI